MIRTAKSVALALILAATMCNVAAACPTCKSALHNGLALGYAISILFMMAMPFVIFAFWVVAIVRLRAKASPTNPVDIWLSCEKEKLQSRQ